MIRGIRGRVLDKTEGAVIIETHGLSYQILCSPAAAAECREDSEVFFWTYLAVGADHLTLLGFREKEELELFEKLLSVSGIGPKRAMSILATSSVLAVKQAIVSGETERLVSVIGGGKKNAEKIILELSEVLAIETPATAGETSGDSDTLEALTSLGYSLKEAREAVKKIPAAVTDTGERVKQALKNLSS